MLRHALFYGLAMAALALLLELVAFRHLVRQMPTDLYMLIVAILFASLGIWAGLALTPRKRGPSFVPNEAAIRSLGLTTRERQVLERLAAGDANKEIARTLRISPNTVKTHVANLTEKIGVSGRGRIVTEARALSIIP